MFTLTPEQHKKLAEWINSLKPEIDAIMNGEMGAAAGGYYTYEFTPTGIGLHIKVTEFRTKKSIDLTDYDSW